MKAKRCAKGLRRGLAWLVSLALLLALVLAASGSGVAQASPGPDSVTDSFADEAMIASKLNLVVAGGQVQLDQLFSSGLYGGNEDDHFLSLYADGNYIYAAGYTISEGEGAWDGLLVKFNKGDLSIDSRKVYGGTEDDLFGSVYADSSYVYATGFTNSTTAGDWDALLVKFDISDLSFVSGKVYGGTEDDCFSSVYADGSYVYAAGWTRSEGTGAQEALLVKFNIGDLSIDSKIYRGTDCDCFNSVYADSNYVYAAGFTGQLMGDLDALLVKFNIGDLTIASGKSYGGPSLDYFLSVYADSSNVYAAGFTYSQGMGLFSALLVKFNIDDLSFASGKVYGGTGVESFGSVYADGSYVYAAGDTNSTGQGDVDALLVKFDIGDLSIDSGKVYGGTGLDYFLSVYADTSHIYAAGHTNSTGQGDNDAWLARLDIALPAGTVPDSCGLVCQDSGLNLEDSDLTLADSNLPLVTSDLTLADSALTLADSGLTPAICFSSGTLSSTNLLSGRDVSSIDSFGYNASSIPPSTGLKVQFSQDNTNWYGSGGMLGGWDTCAQGSNSIDLSSLGWSGPSFYYKMEFTSDGAGTPVLDEISVTYSPAAPRPPVGGEAYPVNKLAILAPWVAVALFLAGGVGWFVLKRRRAQG